MHTTEQIIDTMAESWPSTIVARKALREFSGGTISPRTMANLDSLGKGPEDAFLLMNQVCYPVQNLCEWLKKRASKRGK